MEEESRALDSTTSSMDAVALNNFIVSMRKRVKLCRIQLGSKLGEQIKMYKNKKGTEEQKTKSLQKAERIEHELQFVKTVNADKVSRFALGNVLTLVEAASKADLLTKVCARFCEQNQLKNFITKFREEHSDWASLAAFMQAKNTGRRFKINKNPTTNPKTIADVLEREEVKKAKKTLKQQKKNARIEGEIKMLHNDDTQHGDEPDNDDKHYDAEHNVAGDICSENSDEQQSHSSEDDSKLEDNAERSDCDGEEHESEDVLSDVMEAEQDSPSDDELPTKEASTEITHQNTGHSKLELGKTNLPKSSDNIATNSSNNFSDNVKFTGRKKVAPDTPTSVNQEMTIATFNLDNLDKDVDTIPVHQTLICVQENSDMPPKKKKVPTATLR